MYIVKPFLTFDSLCQRQYTNKIIIHHTGNPTDDDLSAKEIHSAHLAQGYAGIGYHFVIRKNGAIEQGRPVRSIGAHCYRHNSDSIGVHLCGNFELVDPTTLQIEAAAELIAVLCRNFNLPIDRRHILGHCELIATACPGKNLFNCLNTLVGKADWYSRA